MLVSLSKKFVFIANLKCASTAIETALRPVSEFAMVEAPFGKHQPFSVFEKRFSWLWEITDVDKFFIFGVMRDPVDFTLSLYNSHMDPKFASQLSLSTTALSFDEFIDSWRARNFDQLKPQHLRFLKRDGTIAAQYIISYDQLTEGISFVAERLGTPRLLALSKINVSHGKFSRADLTAAHKSWIDRQFETDRMFMSQFCNRMLEMTERTTFQGRLLRA